MSDVDGVGFDTPMSLAWYVRLVRRHVGPGPYLDFGCGSGELLRLLAEHGSASGYETSFEAAARARAAAPGCPVHTTPATVPDGVFRGVVSVGPLEPDAPGMWRKALVPDGRAVVVTDDPADRAALERAGFAVLATPRRLLRRPSPAVLVVGATLA